MKVISPNNKNALNKIQAASGLNRGDFARALGYSYDSFKDFYSGRSRMQEYLKRGLIMYQLLSNQNRNIINKLELKK